MTSPVSWWWPATGRIRKIIVETKADATPPSNNSRSCCVGPQPDDGRQGRLALGASAARSGQRQPGNSTTAAPAASFDRLVGANDLLD
jgi:hypothetical protein